MWVCIDEAILDARPSLVHGIHMSNASDANQKTSKRVSSRNRGETEESISSTAMKMMHTVFLQSMGDRPSDPRREFESLQSNSKDRVHPTWKEKKERIGCIVRSCDASFTLNDSGRVSKRDTAAKSVGACFCIGLVSLRET